MLTDKYMEGSPAFYTAAAANEQDVFVIMVGDMPLIASRPYFYRGDEGHKGFFSYPFSQEWKTCVSAAMLWKIVFSENGRVRLYNLGMEKYLTAVGKYTDNKEECALDFDDQGTEFYFTNEGWIAFNNGTGEFYLSYLTEKGFHCPSEWTSSMVTMSDVIFYAVGIYHEQVQVHIADDKLIVFADGEKVSDGEKILTGKRITAEYPEREGICWKGFVANGHLVPEKENFKIYKDTVFSAAIAEACDETKYLSFMSDVHDLPERLRTWLLSLPQEIYLERCVFGGDVTAGNVKSIAAQQAAHGAIGEVVAKYSQKAPVITVGNHECEYDYRWGERKAEEIFPDSVRYGGFIFEDYCIYNLGAGEFCHEDFQSNFPEAVVEELGNWLKDAPKDRVIFINAHYPLHALKTRPKPCGADRMIDLLNRYPNVVCLWGHNHGQHMETGYGRILSAGDEIMYEYESGAKKTIHFTYCSHGAMYDAARTVAPYYGLVAKIVKKNVELTYYDMSGRPVPYKISKGFGTESYKLKIQK